MKSMHLLLSAVLLSAAVGSGSGSRYRQALISIGVEYCLKVLSEEKNLTEYCQLCLADKNLDGGFEDKISEVMEGAMTFRIKSILSFWGSSCSYGFLGMFELMSYNLGTIRRNGKALRHRNPMI
jgi:hypothetical protein